MRLLPEHVRVRPGGTNMGKQLIELSNELVRITQEIDSYIVSVRARRHYPAGGCRLGPDAIVTANHAVQRDEDLTVTLSGGNEVKAVLVGRDAGTDLAV